MSTPMTQQELFNAMISQASVWTVDGCEREEDTVLEVGPTSVKTVRTEGWQSGDFYATETAALQVIRACKEAEIAAIDVEIAGLDGE